VRLFVAIPLPEEIRRQLAGLTEQSQGLRRVPGEQMHLTLKFIGDLGSEALNELTQSLAAIRFNSFDLRLKPPGAFPDEVQPRVIWMGVDRSPELMALQQSVEQAVLKVGTEDRHQEYRPHITLARAGRSAADRAQVLLGSIRSRVESLEECWRVDSFVLFESRREPTGAIYRIRQSFPATELI